MHSWPVAYLCNFLLVVNYQQRYRQQDGSEALNSFLKPPGRGKLVTLLQAGNEVREAQAHSRQALFCTTVLKKNYILAYLYSKRRQIRNR